VHYFLRDHGTPSSINFVSNTPNLSFSLCNKALISLLKCFFQSQGWVSIDVFVSCQMAMKVSGSVTGSINSTMTIINSKEGLIGVLLKMNIIKVMN